MAEWEWVDELFIPLRFFGNFRKKDNHQFFSSLNESNTLEKLYVLN